MLECYCYVCRLFLFNFIIFVWRGERVRFYYAQAHSLLYNSSSRKKTIQKHSKHSTVQNIFKIFKLDNIVKPFCFSVYRSLRVVTRIDFLMLPVFTVYSFVFGRLVFFFGDVLFRFPRILDGDAARHQFC